MYISDRALEHLENTAQTVGFGRRDDYPFRGHGAVSCGDWKGSSIVACVFFHESQAKEYLAKALPALTALGSEVEGQLVSVSDEGFGDRGCVAVITATDLVHIDDIDESGIVAG